MNLLSIGGSDPSSGAGIQSDIKSFEEFGAYGLTAITAITSQNTTNFGKIEPVSKTMLKNQIDSVLADFKIDGIKKKTDSEVSMVADMIHGQNCGKKRCQTNKKQKRKCNSC